MFKLSKLISSYVHGTVDKNTRGIQPASVSSCHANICPSWNQMNLSLIAKYLDYDSACVPTIKNYIWRNDVSIWRRCYVSDQTVGTLKQHGVPQSSETGGERWQYLILFLPLKPPKACKQVNGVWFDTSTICPPSVQLGECLEERRLDIRYFYSKGKSSSLVMLFIACWTINRRRPQKSGSTELSTAIKNGMKRVCLGGHICLDEKRNTPET